MTTKIEWTQNADGCAGKRRRTGPAPDSPRDGDKRQARRRINVEVRTGRRPHPNELPCVDCGHTWAPGERRHEYDHHNGYAAKHHYDVVAVCTTCHAKRTTYADVCKNGHDQLDPAVSYVDAKGHRICRECRRVRERKTRTADWWARLRERKRAQ